MVFNWKYSPKMDPILTLLLPFHYSSPLTFKELLEDNFNANPMGGKFASRFKLLLQLANEVIHLMSHDQHKNYPILIGDDFSFVNANKDFEVLDCFMMLVKSNNEHYFEKLEVKYSTPSKYFDEIRKESFSIPMVEKADFFPLNEKENLIDPTAGTWTGFYTSRVVFKHKFTFFNTFLTQSKRLLASKIHKYGKSRMKLLQKSQNKDTHSKINGLINLVGKANWMMGVLTHHDAITGTSTKSTMIEYEKSMNIIYSEILSSLTNL